MKEYTGLNKREQSDRRSTYDDRRVDARIAKRAQREQQDFLRKFETESDKRIVQYFIVCLLMAMAIGFYFTIKEIVIDEILLEKPEDLVAVARFDQEKKEEKKKEKVEKKKIRKKTGGGGQKRGRGRPEDVNGVGVLKLISSRSKSSAYTAYDLMKAKFTDVDKAITKVAGLKTTGDTRLSGRKGRTDAGFNEGFASGGSGGIDDLLGGLLGGDGGPIGVKAKGKLRAPSASEIDMGSAGSRRSAASILRVVRQHTPGLRHTYNKHLKTNPGFSGKIHIKFHIAPSGSVVKVESISSTTGAPDFDQEIITKVRRWRFEPITGTGNDIVTIPFTFSE